MTTTLTDVWTDALACPRADGDPRLSGVLLDVNLIGAGPAMTTGSVALTSVGERGLRVEHAVQGRLAGFGGAYVSTDDNFITRSGPPPGRPPA